LKPKARRFLDGLSCDELQFIAEFLGASCLESGEPDGALQGDVLERIVEFQRARPASQCPSSRDQDHKTIVLLEFLCRSGLQRAPLAARATHA
jgi:hypothetical protein